jgi:2-methylcitrate dehydratase PrpD
MKTDNAQTISGRLANYANKLTYDDLPDDVRKRAHLVLLDTLGCAMAGSGTEEIAQIRRAMLQANGGGGDASYWGTHDKAPLPLAALANGAAVHAREIDDFGGCAHSGAVVIPAALGVAARTGASGKDLLTAIVVGYDIARRVMDGGGGYQAFKKLGWHSTSACGGFGAAAAAAKLLGLDAQHIQWALGYAGSNAGGTWAYIPDGAMSKRIHPGFAAHTGVVAAYLAANDVTGPTQIFEAPWGGYYPTYVGGRWLGPRFSYSSCRFQTVCRLPRHPQQRGCDDCPAPPAQGQRSRCQTGDRARQPHPHEAALQAGRRDHAGCAVQPAL